MQKLSIFEPHIEEHYAYKKNVTQDTSGGHDKKYST